MRTITAVFSTLSNWLKSIFSKTVTSYPPLKSEPSPMPSTGPSPTSPTVSETPSVSAPSRTDGKPTRYVVTFRCIRRNMAGYQENFYKFITVYGQPGEGIEAQARTRLPNASYHAICTGVHAS